MKFVIKKSKSPEQPWYFTIENKGKVLCSSETYHNTDDVMDTIGSIKDHALSANVITPERTTGK